MIYPYEWNSFWAPNAHDSTACSIKVEHDVAVRKENFAGSNTLFTRLIFSMYIWSVQKRRVNKFAQFNRNEHKHLWMHFFSSAFADFDWHQNSGMFDITTKPNHHTIGMYSLHWYQRSSLSPCLHLAHSYHIKKIFAEIHTRIHTSLCAYVRWFTWINNATTFIDTSNLVSSETSERRFKFTVSFFRFGRQQVIFYLNEIIHRL